MTKGATKYSGAKMAKLSQRLIVLDMPRTFFLSIPKCGCTYVKNVLWHLKEGHFHGNQLRIHDYEQHFSKANQIGVSPEDILREPRAFTVLRSPVDRLLSLYLDKVVGQGRRDFVPLADVLEQRRGFVIAPQSAEEHRRNLEHLIDWVEENLFGTSEIPRNPHWTPQSFRIDVMRAFDLKILVVDKLSLGLLSLFSDYGPARVAIAFAERNRASRALAKSEYLSPAIRRKVNSIYAQDRDLFQVASEYWQSAKGFDPVDVSAPRLSELMNLGNGAFSPSRSRP